MSPTLIHYRFIPIREEDNILPNYLINFPKKKRKRRERERERLFRDQGPMVYGYENIQLLLPAQAEKKNVKNVFFNRTMSYSIENNETGNFHVPD